jgi:hypothetical protein
MPENMLKYVGKKLVRKDAGRGQKARRYYAVDIGIKRKFIEYGDCIL